MGAQLQLLPEGAILWPDRKVLLIADLHLGKVQHFRNEGIPLPGSAGQACLDKLERIIRSTQPSRVIFLGDLFHSDYNQDWIRFKNIIEQFPDIEFILVQGNHDILDQSQYNDSTLHVVPEPYTLSPFLLTHHPQECIMDGLYNLCGHIHPAVRLRGKAKQSLRLPCFYFGDYTGILPAFGTFTGSYTVSPQEGESVYVIADGAVIPVQ